MKKLAYLLLFVAAAVLFPLQLCANDYLEVQRHYQVYSNGRNSIHFKIPVWAYGRVNDYHLDSAFTTIRWQVKGQSVEPFMYVGGPAYGVNRQDNDRGNARVKMYKKANSSESKGGVIVVTNEYNGNRLQIDRTDDYTTIDLKQVADDDCKRVTILEFDWYPPVELNNKKFTISIQTDIRTKSASSADYNPLFTFPTTFTGGDNTAAPQLYTPYLYMVNESGVTGRGLAAIPYYSQAKPISYTHPLSSKTVQIQENSGTMYVPTSDSGYYAFDAAFKVYRNEETGDTETIHSNAIHVPAYHRIYDFQATAQQDEYGSYTGATLFTNGITWTMPKGISLSTTGKPVYVQPTLFSRADAEDYSLLFWFRSVNDDNDSVSLFGTSIGDSVTMELTLHDNVLSYRAGEIYEETKAALMDGVWHHCALVVSKTFNSAFIAVDGEKLLTFASIPTGALSGTKMWFAKGMEGNLDDICLFEQALPDELVAEFGKQSPNGEEMGLINLLTFSQIKRNSASVMELVFSPNNQRVFKDPNGKVIAKEQPLLVEDLSSDADKEDSAPVRDRGQLTKLPFTWNYQLSELMINIKAQPREINKRTMYLTVRDVEDVNGNRLSSPVMWTVYANLNSVIWNERRHVETLMDNEDSHRFTMLISNTTGMTRQFTIEHIPEWLTVSPTQGTLDAEEEKSVTFTINASLLKIGTHQQIIYLIDDQGLSEPLMLEINKETEPPYTDVDLNKYPFNMSLCGRVMVEENGKTVINTDEEDFVYAIYNNECVGVAHCTNRGELYLTIHGSEAMNSRPVRFQLWKAATGKVYNLIPDREITFAHGFVFGCGNDEPVVLTAGGSEMQTISLNKGWNWISTYLQVPSSLQTAITAEQPWTEGDLIKNPATRQFCTYSEQTDNFVGTLNKLHFSHMYMVYNASANNMHIFGDELSQDSMQIVLRGDGHWSELPCLYEQVISLREAMGDYYSYASPGDIIKSHNHFATFSTDKRWVGDLTSLTPGEGYLFRRMGSGSVAINFYKYRYSAPKHKALPIKEESEVGFHASSATNMTMIATIEGLVDERVSGLEVYIDDQLVGVAKPIQMSNVNCQLSNGEALYFLTIQSDAIGGALRFETEDGTALTPVTGNPSPVTYRADAHYGTLEKPVLLTPSPRGEGRGEVLPYKLIENDHVVIIRNGERYDVTGKKIE